MVSVYLEGINTHHDIFELIRVFFPNEGINFISDKSEYKEGYLITVTLISNEIELLSLVSVYLNGDLIKECTEDIREININRSIDIAIKIGIKKSVYNVLIDLTKNNLPWGILTGIRPVKIVHELLEHNINDETILNILTREYKLDSNKARLIIDIANKQMKYLYPIDKEKFSLYISIPFCPTRCIYCSFPSLPIKKYRDLVTTYIDNLIYEIDNIHEIMGNKRINTVYIGGGTPTSIATKDLERIIESIYKNFGENNIKEFTVEAGRPDTINAEVLKMLKLHNVNRISINPQTMNDNTLKIMGRNHTSLDIVKAYNMAKEIGIEVINMDLIIGLPGEGINEIDYTLNRLEELDPENLTVHTLAVKRGSVFKEHIKEYEIDSQQVIGSMLERTKDYANKMNLEPYYLYRQKQILGNFENIGYTKANKECIYNISIMEEKETIIAAGMGAVSKIYYPEENKLERVPNFKDLKEYLTRIHELVERKRKFIY